MSTTMQYTPIKVEYINPFIESTMTVFRTMLNQTARRGSIYLKNAFQQSHEVTGVIGLSGMARGSVVVGLSQTTALQVTSILLNEPCETINHNTIDAVGELLNMIAGSAKAKLEELKMSIGLPTVVLGSNHSVMFPTGVQPIGIPFETGIGPLCLEVSLVNS